jgi:hypothetical protein
VGGQRASGLAQMQMGCLAGSQIGLTLMQRDLAQATRPLVFAVFLSNFGRGRPIKGYANEVSQTAVQACANGTIDKRRK